MLEAQSDSRESLSDPRCMREPMQGREVLNPLARLATVARVDAARNLGLSFAELYLRAAGREMHRQPHGRSCDQRKARTSTMGAGVATAAADRHKGAQHARTDGVPLESDWHAPGADEHACVASSVR